jgi:hypothetical protein
MMPHGLGATPTKKNQQTAEIFRGSNRLGLLLFDLVHQPIRHLPNRHHF